MDKSSPAAAPAEESPAERQARIRRQKREAKLKADPAERLNKITSLSGRPVEPPSSSTPKPSVADDPAEVDISDHYYSPARASAIPRYDNNAPSQQPMPMELQQFLRGEGPPPSMPGNSFGMPGQPGGNMSGQAINQDPMMQMLQQMMGGIPGGPGRQGAAGGGAGGLPPGLAEMLGGAGAAQAAPALSSTYIWKIVHFLAAFSLAIYITMTIPFTGSKADRFLDPSLREQNVRLFWYFATAELGLQSTRYFLEQGQEPQGGIIATVAGFLPMPYRGYLQLIMRYSSIYTTIVQDAMVILFVLGCVAWWKGAT